MFNLVSIDFIWLQLISIYFQLISIDFNLLSIDFNLLSTDFNWFSIGFHLLSIDFNWFSIDFNLQPQQTYYGCFKASDILEIRHFENSKEWSKESKKRKILAKERKMKGEKDFGKCSFQKIAGHHRGPPQQTYYWNLLKINLADGVPPWKIVWVLCFNNLLIRNLIFCENGAFWWS